MSIIKVWSYKVLRQELFLRSLVAIRIVYGYKLLLNKAI
jgi:hypothetical protein